MIGQSEAALRGKDEEEGERGRKTERQKGKKKQ